MTFRSHNIYIPLVRFVTLEDNTKTQFQARELKTIYVDIVARYLKFVLSEPYENDRNNYKQVGIMALIVFGDGVRPIPGQDGSRNVSFAENALGHLKTIKEEAVKGMYIYNCIAKKIAIVN
jgi:hypothetical protein